MNHRMICWNIATLMAALVFSSSVFSAQDPSFRVDAENLPGLAFNALAGRYPGISAGDVEIESPVFFNCSAKPNIVGPGAISSSVLKCMATVNFDVSGTDIEYYYLDAEGSCRLLKPPRTASVHVISDGSARVHFHPGNVSEGLDVDCNDEVITRIALVEVETERVFQPFSVDAATVLELAFDAAHEQYDEIPADQLVYGDGPDLVITCDVKSGFAGIDPEKAVTGACKANVRLANESVRLDYRYISAGLCMIGKATDWITVNIDQGGFSLTRTPEYSAGGRARSVACDEAFYDSPLPLITSPAMGG